MMSKNWKLLALLILALFIITVAAAEVAVGLALIIALFKNKQTVNVDELDIMKW